MAQFFFYIFTVYKSSNTLGSSCPIRSKTWSPNFHHLTSFTGGLLCCYACPVLHADCCGNHTGTGYKKNVNFCDQTAERLSSLSFYKKTDLPLVTPDLWNVAPKTAFPSFFFFLHSLHSFSLLSLRTAENTRSLLAKVGQWRQLSEAGLGGNVALQ